MNQNHIKYLLRIFSFAAALALAFSVSGCAKKAEPLKKTHFALDTVIELTLYDGEKEKAIDECMALIDRYEQLFSRTIEGSDVWRINHANGEPVTVSQETAQMIGIAIKYSKLSEGLFDITIAPVSSMWEFEDEPHVVPEKAKIDEAIKLVDYRQIVLDGNVVRLSNPKGAIDLGGIAKGYIADKLVEFLKTRKVTKALINLGGNIVVMGERPDGTPWRVGVQGAFQDRNTAVAMFEVRDLSVVTSGIYERYFILNGNFYHHILNSKTGYPIENELAGVSILSEKSVDGDCLSTTCFTLGIEKSKQLINTLDGIEAVFIDKQGKLYYTNGIGTDEKAKYQIILLNQEK